MNRTRLTTMLGALLALTLVAPGALLARPLTTHSADFQRMQAAVDELAQKSGADFEITYVNMIIPHHQGAIDMAQMVVNDAPHQEVRDEAAQIISEQETEIAELTTFLQQQYGQQVNLDSRMMMDMSMMDMMMDMDATMREKHFLAMMREHHEIANKLGALVLQTATSQTLLDQAQEMIDSQTAQQQRFAAYLLEFYGITAPEPTGDMQDAMDLVMNMGLPETGAEDVAMWTFLAGALALLAGGYVLRRKLA